MRTSNAEEGSPAEGVTPFPLARSLALASIPRRCPGKDGYGREISCGGMETRYPIQISLKKPLHNSNDSMPQKDNSSPTLNHEIY